MPDDAQTAAARGTDWEGDATGRRMVLAACLIATFMAAVESTIVATAMPTIVADLGGFNLFSWVFATYLLTQAVSIPVYGRLADLYGRKPVFFAGAGLFLCGSTLCGFAWGMAPLIFFRALQGFGAGAVQPIAATILGDIYTPAERARVQGLVSSVFGISAVVGPSLGAFLVEHVAWPIVFWVNLPIGVAAIAMIAAYLPENVERRQHRIDYLGSLLLLGAVGGLMVILVQGGTLPRLTLNVAACLAILAAAGLVAHERSTPEPMLPLELWRNRIIVLGSFGGCAAGAVMMGISAFLPAYVQGAMERTPIAGGLVLGAMSVSWALASILAARVMMWTSYRFTAGLGGAALVSGCAILVAMTPARGVLWAAWGSLTIGVGMGLCNTVFIVSIQAAVPWRKRGAATSSAMFLRFIGQALGAAGCGAVLNATLLTRTPDAAGVVDRLLDPAQRGALPPAEAAALSQGLAHGLHNAYWLAAAFAAVALVLALCLPAHLNPVRQKRG
jgi:EmrB/QacA subfamily drug resistance transporter